MADGPGRRAPTAGRQSLSSEGGADDAAALLQAVADALTACKQAGVKVKLKHNAVYSPAGYVLPAADGWVARNLAYSPFWPDDLDEGDDLDD